jgi:hypothetical protein
MRSRKLSPTCTYKKSFLFLVLLLLAFSACFPLYFIPFTLTKYSRMIWLVRHRHLTPNTFTSPGVPVSMSESVDPPVPPSGPILPPPGMAAPPTPFEVYSAKVAAKATFREGEDVDWEGPECVPNAFEFSSDAHPFASSLLACSLLARSLLAQG